nr:uncharacterized protein LOC115931732 [Gorilla gorilla gorilla]
MVRVGQTMRPAVDSPGALASSGGGDLTDSMGKIKMSADFERWDAVACDGEGRRVMASDGEGLRPHDKEATLVSRWRKYRRERELRPRAVGTDASRPAASSGGAEAQLQTLEDLG